LLSPGPEAKPLRFPPVIPVLRHQTLPKDVSFTNPWVGVGLRDLVVGAQRGSRRLRIRKVARCAESLRSSLGVPASTRILAILNAKDNLLECFWHSDREALLSDLQLLGIGFVTGPTYSVIRESAERLPCANVIMMQRNNEVCQQIGEVGLSFAPCIYWREDGALPQSQLKV
jgi:hypothetical protein